MRVVGDVTTELWSVANKWKDIGIFLGLDYNFLESCDRFEAVAALKAVVEAWLTRKYDCVAYGDPTWKKLVEVVHSEAGAGDRALASKMAASRRKRH